MHIFGASYELDALQNNYLENNNTLGIPLPNSYAIELRRDSWDKPFINPARRYIVVLGG